MHSKGYSLLILAAAFLALPLTANAQHAFTPGPAVAIQAPSEPTLPQSFGGGIVLTQSEALDVVSGGVRCGNATAGYSTENSFYRVFDLSEYPEVSEGFTVNEVGAGIIVGPWPEGTPTQTGAIRLYNLTAPPEGGIIDIANLELIAEEEFEIVGPAEAAYLQPVAISAGFSGSQLLAVEMFLPTGDPAVNTELPGPFSLSQGGNEFGTTATEYLASESCGITNPQDITTLGDFQSEWVVTVTGTAGAVANEDGAVAQRVTLGQNFPNPVISGATAIPFSLESAQNVTVAVFDALGREVTATAATFSAGEQSVRIDTSALPNGVYFYRINAGDTTQTRKMVVMQ